MMPPSPQKNPKTVVVGSTSSLARAICHVLAARGHTLTLVGRDEYELELQAADLAVRHAAPCRIAVADVVENNFSAEKLVQNWGEFDEAIIALGYLSPDFVDIQHDIVYTSHLNFIIPAQIAQLACETLAKKHGGKVTIISSVAGDRGRQSNYPYGAAKAALTAFASGLRNKFAKQGVHVMTVKPGFIDTPMTWGMKSPLIASPKYVAKKIVDAAEKNKDVIYVPFFWRFIMLIICHIPERIFKRLSL